MRPWQWKGWTTGLKPGDVVLRKADPDDLAARDRPRTLLVINIHTSAEDGYQIALPRATFLADGPRIVRWNLHWVEEHYMRLDGA